MSRLAFDKEGRRFEFMAQTRALGVRRFRNPGGRGTCEVVFDDSGEPLQVEAEASVPEFREEVDHVPGLYRLDQLDADGNEIKGAPAAYITIDPPRNAAGSTGTDSMSVVRDLAQINGEVTKTFADKAAGMMDALTECVRVVGGMPSKRLLANAALGLGAGADADGDDEEEDDEDEDDDGDSEPEPTPTPAGPSDQAWKALMAVLPMIQPALPKIGEVLGAKLAELVNLWLGKTPPAAGAAPATATASATASGPAPSGAGASGPAAGSSASGATAAAGSTAPSRGSPTPSTSSSSSDAATEPTSRTTPPTPTDDATEEVSTALASVTVAEPPATGEVRNAAPTPAQIAHLMTISAQLAPREVTIVERVIDRMDGATRAAWLAELSSLTVERAVARVRALIGNTGSPQRMTGGE